MVYFQCLETCLGVSAGGRSAGNGGWSGVELQLFNLSDIRVRPEGPRVLCIQVELCIYFGDYQVSAWWS